MRLRIGDLVTFSISLGGKGLVTALGRSFWVGCGNVEVYIKGESLKTILGREGIISVTPREEIKEYWRYL